MREIIDQTQEFYDICVVQTENSSAFSMSKEAILRDYPDYDEETGDIDIGTAFYLDFYLREFLQLQSIFQPSLSLTRMNSRGVLDGRITSEESYRSLYSSWRKILDLLIILAQVLFRFGLVQQNLDLLEYSPPGRIAVNSH
jgi:hypothetical protein